MAQASARRGGKQPLLRNTFGRLYEWLSSDLAKDPGDIRRILRTHIFETVEVETGEKVLGEAMPTRRLHSVASLASGSGLDRRTLKNVLVAKGLIPDDELHHVFDAELGRRPRHRSPTWFRLFRCPKCSTALDRRSASCLVKGSSSRSRLERAE